MYEAGQVFSLVGSGSFDVARPLDGVSVRHFDHRSRSRSMLSPRRSFAMRNGRGGYLVRLTIDRGTATGVTGHQYPFSSSDRLRGRHRR